MIAQPTLADLRRGIPNAADLLAELDEQDPRNIDDLGQAFVYLSTGRTATEAGHRVWGLIVRLGALAAHTDAIDLDGHTPIGYALADLRRAEEDG
ncbi:MAG: hypothetical protein ACYCWW_17085 [Deltaproteobacteria bacterium]